jgi:EmrB/QacA subfamily drug resistance transporter
MGSEGTNWKPLALLCTAFFMAMLDSSIVLVALPSIDGDLAFPAADLQWVMSAYMLSFGGLLLLGGRAADLLGQRRMFTVGVALFGVASLGAGLSAGPAALIAARALQGVAAAIMTPAAQSLLMTTFAEGPERNKALGFWTATGAIGGTAGWLIGGPITDGLGWEWIFFLNFPIGIAIALLAPLVLRENRTRRTRRRFDLAGATTITVALATLVYAVVEAPQVGWATGRTIGLLALAAALVGSFVAVEARSPAPLLPLGVLRSRGLAAGNLILLCLGMMALGMPFILTKYAQEVLGWTPVQFGFAFVVMPILVAIGSAVGQSLATKGATRAVASGGMVLTGLACLGLTNVSVAGDYLGELFVPFVGFGLGVGFAYVSGSIASLSGVAEGDAGLASGMNNASFQIGGAIGTAILSSVAISGAAGGSGASALTAGFQSAFAVAIAFAAIGALAAFVLLRRHGEPAVADAEAANA